MIQSLSMINQGKFKILESYICACDYEYVLFKIRQAIKNKQRLLISPIASQTLVIAENDLSVKKVLDEFDLLVPDSYWVMKSLNWIHKTHLKERVYGPNLMLQTCALAEKRKYSIFLYGTHIQTLVLLKKKLLHLFPLLKLAGIEPSKYRSLDKSDHNRLSNTINRSGVNILFIALGSSLQEEVAVQLKPLLKPLIVITVGAAFDFISEVKKQAPKWVQNVGLEWSFRLLSEPRRLWKRYTLYPIPFILKIINQYYSH